MKKNFKKSDLKTGMQIEQRDGGRYVVLLDTKAGDVYCGLGGDDTHGSLNYTKENMENKTDKSLDIIAVYVNGYVSSFVSKKMEIDDLIWEKESRKTIITHNDIEYSESTIRSILDKFAK